MTNSEYTKAQLWAVTVVECGLTDIATLEGMSTEEQFHWMTENLKTPIQHRSRELAGRLGGLWGIDNKGVPYFIDACVGLASEAEYMLNLQKYGEGLIQESVKPTEPEPPYNYGGPDDVYQEAPRGGLAFALNRIKELEAERDKFKEYHNNNTAILERERKAYSQLQRECDLFKTSAENWKKISEEMRGLSVSLMQTVQRQAQSLPIVTPPRDRSEAPKRK